MFQKMLNLLLNGIQDTECDTNLLDHLEEYISSSGESLMVRIACTDPYLSNRAYEKCLLRFRKNICLSGRCFWNQKISADNLYLIGVMSKPVSFVLYSKFQIVEQT